MRTIIEPHIHMYSRTTDDYQAMYNAGIRACVEPSFWLGSHRRYAGTFFDYFENILTFEPTRSERFGIDHFTAIAYNPKEAENKTLVDEVLDGIGEYLDHPRCVAMGEIGFNNINEAEYYCFTRQLRMAKERDMPVIIHISHYNKPTCLEWVLRGFDEVQPDQKKIYLDHNTEDTIERALAETDCWCGLTVYPISKLDPMRASAIIKKHGIDRIIVSGSADWGISDPVSLVKVLEQLKADGHPEETLQKVAFDNPNAFYSQSPKWKPRLDLVPWKIELRQP
ncbi:MAG: TatD family hydrolase [Kiritimatiellae bacterium]|nr:TatD family hydrolase [Kiritimatiellia bacterium]